METESVIMDVTCVNSIWEQTYHKIMPSDVFYAISTDNMNFSDCLGVDLFQSRNYQRIPQAFLHTL